MFNHYFCQVSLSSSLLVFPLQTWKTVGRQPLSNHLSSSKRHFPRCPSALFFQGYIIYLLSIFNISIFYLINHLDYFLLNPFHLFYNTPNLVL